MPILPIERTSRTLGPTGVAVLALDDIEERAPSRLRIDYLLGGPADAEGVSSPPARMARMFVNTMAAFTTTLFVTLSAFALVPYLFGYHSAIVTSASMAPSLQRSDVVVLAPVGDGPVAVGQIINFRSEDGDVIHRVEAIDPDGLRTRGDANLSADSTLVERDDISGTAVFLVPFVGMPPLWVDDGDWWKLAVLAAVLSAAGYTSRRAWLTPALATSATGRSSRADTVGS